MLAAYSVSVVAHQFARVSFYFIVCLFFFNNNLLYIDQIASLHQTMAVRSFQICNGDETIRQCLTRTGHPLCCRMGLAKYKTFFSFAFFSYFISPTWFIKNASLGQKRHYMKVGRCCQLICPLRIYLTWMANDRCSLAILCRSVSQHYLIRGCTIHF